MSRALIIAALRRGETSPEILHRAADLLEGKKLKRGRKPHTDERKLAEAFKTLEAIDAGRWASTRNSDPRSASKARYRAEKTIDSAFYLRHKIERLKDFLRQK